MLEKLRLFENFRKTLEINLKIKVFYWWFVLDLKQNCFN